MVETRVVYLEPGNIIIDTMECRDPGPTEVMIKAYQASVCGSERYYYRGISVREEDEARSGPGTQLGAGRLDGQPKHAYPMGPLGHEGGGTIVAMGAGVKEYIGGGIVSIGDKVGSLIYPTYTDYWVTDIQHVQPIPDDVSFEVGCLYEPLGCAAWAARHMGVQLGDTVAVNGVGFAGNIMMQGAIKSGASMVVAIDVVQSKLDIAKKLGADYTINANEVDPLEVINDVTHGVGVDVSAEAVGGTGIGIVQALNMVRHNGIIALYGDSYAPVSSFCFHRFHEDGLEIRNLNAVHYTQLRSIENMREAYTAVRRGVFDVAVILENSVTYKLDDLAGVFADEAEALDMQTSLKTIILP